MGEASSVMGPGALGGRYSYSDKVPPVFDGRTTFEDYREDVELWLALTSLEGTKQGPAIVGRLFGEAKQSAKTLGVKAISKEDGAKAILDHLEKSYGVGKTDQLDIDLANFLDYSWTKDLSVEQFVAGFHSRLDRIASLSIDDKLKGHLLKIYSIHTALMQIANAHLELLLTLGHALLLLVKLPWITPCENSR